MGLPATSDRLRPLLAGRVTRARTQDGAVTRCSWRTLTKGGLGGLGDPFAVRGKHRVEGEEHIRSGTKQSPRSPRSPTLAERVGSRTDLVLRDRQIILGRQYKAPRLQPDCRRSVRRARAPMATDLSVSDGSAGRAWAAHGPAWSAVDCHPAPPGPGVASAARVRRRTAR